MDEHDHIIYRFAPKLSLNHVTDVITSSIEITIIRSSVPFYATLQNEEV